MKAPSVSSQPQQGFEDLRGYLFSIAYRMLGTVADADDIVQDAWVRWERNDRSGIENPRGYLASIVTRLCLDRLREVKRRREEYVGPWLPEPLVSNPPPDGGEMAESLSLAFLTLLERLTPAERAVFLLRQVFGYEYAEIAAIVETTEANCRQLFSRANKHVQEGRPRYDASPEVHRRLLDGFVGAVAQGDLNGLMALLKEDIVLWSDGGGKVAAAIRPLHGAKNVGSFFIGVAKRGIENARVEHTMINGSPGLLLYEGDRLDSVFTIEVVDGQIATFHIVRNPLKLKHLGVR
jgi:RNA polymerase sigma-70 factor (ECF subfamily)